MARTREILLIMAGLAVLLLGAIVAGDGTVPGWEEDAFRAVNDLPGWLYTVLWPVQLLGTLAVVPTLPLIFVVRRNYWLATAVVLAGVTKLVSERIVKAIVTRERPGTSI